jgi:hypothetical protein
VLETVAVRTKLKFWNELCAAGLFKSKSDTPPNEAAKWLGVPPSGSKLKLIENAVPGCVARFCESVESDPIGPAK